VIQSLLFSVIIEDKLPKLQGMNNLDRILDDVMALPIDGQELLLQILRNRIIERKRDEIAQDAIDSLAEFRSGKLGSQSATNVIAELRTFLQDDSAESKPLG
jgi:hypothetical protein